MWASSMEKVAHSEHLYIYIYIYIYTYIHNSAKAIHRGMRFTVVRLCLLFMQSNTRSQMLRCIFTRITQLIIISFNDFYHHQERDSNSYDKIQIAQERWRLFFHRKGRGETDSEPMCVRV